MRLSGRPGATPRDPRSIATRPLALTCGHGERLTVRGSTSASLINAVAPGKIRSGEGNDQLEMECPYDGDHSNAGDESDRAFFVTNAQSPHGEWFGAYCNHNACQDHNKNKLDFICAMINDGTISVDDITGSDYLLESDEEIALKALKTGVDGLNERTGKGSIDKVLEQLATLESSLPPTEFAGYLTAVEAKTGMKTKAVATALSKATKKVADERKAAAGDAANERAEEEQLNQNAASVGGADVKPQLAIGGDHFDYMTATAWGRLTAINKTREKFFEIGNKPVRLLDPDAEGRILPQVFTTDSMVAELNEHVRWVKKSRDGCPLVVNADDDVAKQLLNQTSLHFPQLDSIVSSPYFTKDGILISKRGYNADARTYYNPPAGFELPDIPEHPTAKDVKAARELIERNVLIDFPWSDGDGYGDGTASRAHALVLLLQQFMRPMIPGNLPITFVQKPEAGSGASLLIQSLMYIPTGRKIGAQTEKSSSDELRKALTAHVLSKEPAFFLDNINGHMHGSALANFATCGVWDDRKLGVSENVRAPVRSTTIVAGNNVGMTGEIARRCVPVGLDALRDPTERAVFTRDLETWIPENRAELVGACLTLIRYWIDQGCHEWDGKPLASFEGYSKTMGGLLRLDWS